MSAAEVGVAVNYYWNDAKGRDRRLADWVTQLGLFFLRQSPVVGTVVLVDGSPEPSRPLERVCGELDVRYLHAGRELSLPEGYNLGWRSLPERFVGLMANDILPYPPSIMETLMACLRRPDVGCVFPYLTNSDYPPQVIRFVYKMRRTCEPAGMTLNLNLFRREALEEVGGVDEGYLVGFYDPILVIKLRRKGWRVVQVGDTAAIHLNRLTHTSGVSTLTGARYVQDDEHFSREYPEYRARHGIWKMTFWSWPFATTPSAAACWWISQHFPWRPGRQALEKLTMILEPYLTSFPARHGARAR